MYIQGLFNQVVYWPTYTWSYLHVVLASLFICIWVDIRDGNIEGAMYDDEPEEEMYNFDETPPEDFEDYEEGSE